MSKPTELGMGLRGFTATTAGMGVAATAPPETAREGMDAIGGAGMDQMGVSESASIRKG